MHTTWSDRTSTAWGVGQCDAAAQYPACNELAVGVSRGAELYRLDCNIMTVDGQGGRALSCPGLRLID
jgi:hypothetical protein